MRRLPSPLMFVAGACLLTGMPSAQAGTLIVSPAVIELHGATGQATQQSITMLNQTDVSRTFELVANDVVIVDGKRQFKSAGETPGSIAANVVFVPQRVHIPAMQSRTVTFNASVPSNVAHRAIVAIFAPVGETNTEHFVTTAGVLVTFSLGAQSAMEASPLQFVAQTAAHNASFTTVLTNSGSEPVVEQGLIVIQKESGQVLGKIPTPSHRLLPNETFDVLAEYPGELPTGEYNVLATFEYGPQSVTQRRRISVP